MALLKIGLFGTVGYFVAKKLLHHVKILNNVHRADMSGSKNPGSNRRTFHGRHTISILQSSAMMPVSLDNQLFPRFSSQQAYFDGSGGGDGSNGYKTLGWASTYPRFYKANWDC
ncbi:hypothetical protein PENARI_c009G00738 [Penicillium arizonense]|uniref:Uncharacterized protein n=1 Tax=Penicillium arizonense TaxID=1835702 RepID=A0A1F5LI57_PENAI|nr:hypothetical protein PENARI_c009G00738 [Penicillium arizonense]OGE52892.1 hypothetical protein PENARI_c009G00738 [Penicillium arizonense]